MSGQIFVGNDNDVLIQGYRLASNNAPILDALFTFSVAPAASFDGLGNPLTAGSIVAGLSAVVMSAVVGTPGDYRGVLPGTASLTAGTWYEIVATPSNYNDQVAGWFLAATRLVPNT